ncbi:hypothetical protein AB0B31_25475 [Catellatospora citrea]|uniref:hypothetical protein n=1 Tax=Catellatospora citrea TaxID=53366 RepID=UPI003409587F
MASLSVEEMSGSAVVPSGVFGPQWCEPGLLSRAGRYPLAVEAPLMAAVGMLAPGVSTVTRYARYYSLYWALAAHVYDAGLTRDECRQLLRRAEVGLARISQFHDDPDDALGVAHGVDALGRLDPAEGAEFTVADSAGSGSYSPRSWGFWSQYNGPSVALGTAALEGGILRPGRHPCPRQVAEMFAPLISIAGRGTGLRLPMPELEPLSLNHSAPTPDIAPLASVFTATTAAGRHEPEDWTGDDLTRRATLRILARSWQLNPDADTWLQAFANGVAYGSAAREDPLLAAEQRTAAWRGVVLRHHSVGAWRRLWASLVQEVRGTEAASRAHLHDWITGELPSGSVAEFEAALPPIADGHGDPLAAEDRLPFDGLTADVAVLLLGARRLSTLSGVALHSFSGRRPTYLDPTWVAHVQREYAARPLAELGRRLIDDMLAQSRRIALRKVRFHRDGTMSLFTRLHERNGTYFADSAEGRGNIGLRVNQLAGIGVQLGLMTPDGSKPVTSRGGEFLDVPV